MHCLFKTIYFGDVREVLIYLDLIYLKEVREGNYGPILETKMFELKEI